jgi:hypothetical protein
MQANKVVRSLMWRRNVVLVSILGTCLGLTAYAFGETGPGTCAAATESRQLDFWLGNWTMANAGASGGSTSKVYLSLDKCVFVEHWESGKGHVTEKTFAYSPDDKNWYGMFADNEGRAHVFADGKVTSGSAEFHGQSRGPNGETVLNRLRVVKVSPNKLEETWEKSTDSGANWTMVYRAEYTRANP